MRRWIGGASLVASLVLGFGTSSWSEGEPSSFGVISHRSPTLTAQFWNPILRWISERSGVPLQLKVAKTGLEHSAMVGRAEVDFLYSNHNFIKENEASGCRVFARPKEDPGKGEIVVLADSPIRALTDLQGQGSSVPARRGVPGLPPADGCPAAKGIQVTPIFAGNQEGAMGQLKAGRTVAAGVNAEVMRGFAKRERIEYRVLWRSEGYLTFALSALPSVPGPGPGGAEGVPRDGR